MPAPRVLIVHYSRSGHTARLADTLASRLSDLGAEVHRERLRTVRDWPKWVLPLPLLPLLPFLPLYLLSAGFRRFWHRIYYQPSQAIAPLEHPDLQDFDLVLLGTPKWLYLAYPVARWIDRIAGLNGRPVSAFATFCGPPLAVFELEMLFAPLTARLAGRGAQVSRHTLAVSSDYHPYFFRGEMAALFRWLSRRVFGRPLHDFTLDGDVGRANVEAYCQAVFAAASRAEVG